MDGIYCGNRVIPENGVPYGSMMVPCSKVSCVLYEEALTNPSQAQNPHCAIGQFISTQPHGPPGPPATPKCKGAHRVSTWACMHAHTHAHTSTVHKHIHTQKQRITTMHTPVDKYKQSNIKRSKTNSQLRTHAVVCALASLLYYAHVLASCVASTSRREVVRSRATVSSATASVRTSGVKPTRIPLCTQIKTALSSHSAATDVKCRNRYKATDLFFSSSRVRWSYPTDMVLSTLRLGP